MIQPPSAACQQVELDRYSGYLNSQDFSQEANPAYTEKKGIGGMVTRTKDDELILVPFENGPAYQVGIRHPVKLISVENQAASEIEIDDLKLIVNTYSQLKIKAKNLITGENLKVTVSLQPFEVPPVEIIDVDGRKILRLHVFPGKQAFFLLRQNLKKLANSDTPLVIDLRYAVGGDLFEALDSVSLILPQRLPIASTITSDGLSVTYQSRNDLRVAHGPIYLLIGPNTASAAEVFARALHYYGYATLVGQTSFGKCLTQQFIELPNKDGLKLTVGRILDPAGKYCEGEGITPDIFYTKNIYDTGALLNEIIEHNQSHRLVCRFETYTSREALENGIVKLGWDQSETEHRPISLITSNNDWQLCLGPLMSMPSAKLLQSSESNRLKENILPVLLFQQ